MPETDTFGDASERRGTVRLLRYWQSLPRAGIAPAMRNFDPTRNPVPWENCFVISHGDGSKDPIFDHIGEGLFLSAVPAKPSSPGPKLPPELVLHIVSDLDPLFLTGEPIQKDGKFVSTLGDAILFRSIQLLFIDTNHLPRYVLGAVTMCRTQP